MPESVKRIRAVDRGLEVIEYLAKHGRVSLADLRASTGLSNATLLRILSTMLDRNWVRRSLVDSKYELTHSIGFLMHASKHAHPVVEAAVPVLCEMRDLELGYPSDLAISPSPGVIEILETNRQKGPHAPVRTLYGVRPSVIFSAHGKATLAFCAAAEREAHLLAVKRTGTREEKLWLEDGKLDVELESAQKAGFSIRSKEYWAKLTFDVPETGAIACPIFVNGGLAATISVLWLEAHKSLTDIKNEGIPDLLKQAATRIEINLSTGI